ncbi:MAG: cupin domain-containing protein [Atopobiaceae bacterium]|nr:cupin domain-containing protein [Atopobiaceae bacterium]
MPYATGFPNGSLTPRSIVRQGDFALIPQENLCKSTIPGMESCLVSVLASPDLGAKFAFYRVEVPVGKGSSSIIGSEDGIECFAFVQKGAGRFSVNGEDREVHSGSYLYTPAGCGFGFENTGADPMVILLVKQRYRPLAGVAEPDVYFNELSDLEYKPLTGMDNVFRLKLLPTDMSMDLDMMILTFKPGGAHSYAEVHQQEHGMYILEGEGAYWLDDAWTIVQPDDFLWMGPYCPQAAYAVGRNDFSYLFTKDCNRDIEL